MLAQACQPYKSYNPHQLAEGYIGRLVQATHMNPHSDEKEIITALEGASKKIDGMPDKELYQLMQTANEIREQLQRIKIDSAQFALVMLQLGIEAEKMDNKPEFDIAFV